MPGHAVQAGSAFGGFIEGLTGGFQTVTDLRGRCADRDLAEAARLAEFDRIEAIKSDPRISFRLGVAVGTAYATVCIYIERVLARLTRSTRSLVGLQPPMRRSL